MSTQTEPTTDVTKYVEQRGVVNSLKIDTAKMVLEAGREMGCLQEREVTEGMKLMTKMLVKETDGQLESRPAGFAIGFTREPRGEERANQLLFKEGHIILAGPVEVDGELQHVGVDKNGPVLIKGDLLPVLDRVGDQEENMWIKTSNTPNLREGALHGLSITPLEESAETVDIVKKAMIASLESPFISTADYQRNNVPKVEVAQTPQVIPTFGSIDI